VHSELEEELAAWKGTDAAVLFPTGFTANLGVLTTFGGPGVTVLSDELNHASIIDGCRLARARVEVYRHRDTEHLARLLDGADGRCLVATDLVFSMDGDLAPLAELATVCRRRDTLLVLDEAHAVMNDPVDPAAIEGVSVLRVGTLSKTLGALGGFVAGDRAFTDLIVNRARSYIFTTASTPADAAAALAAVRVVRSDEGARLRDRLRAVVDRIGPNHPSPIVPLVVGDERDAVDLADALLARGLLVPAIRPPTVPPGTSRLRVALSAAHTDDQVDDLVAGLDTCWPGWRSGQ
jgi:7-keto-8-aminopelargonate synthetase-like enzyme